MDKKRPNNIDIPGKTEHQIVESKEATPIQIQTPVKIKKPDGNEIALTLTLTLTLSENEEEEVIYSASKTTKLSSRLNLSNEELAELILGSPEKPKGGLGAIFGGQQQNQQQNQQTQVSTVKQPNSQKDSKGGVVVEKEFRRQETSATMKDENGGMSKIQGVAVTSILKTSKNNPNFGSDQKIKKKSVNIDSSNPTSDKQISSEKHLSKPNQAIETNTDNTKVEQDTKKPKGLGTGVNLNKINKFSMAQLNKPSNTTKPAYNKL